MGRDHTLFALKPGFVRFYTDQRRPKWKMVGIVPSPEITFPEEQQGLKRGDRVDSVDWMYPVEQRESSGIVTMDNAVLS